MSEATIEIEILGNDVEVRVDYSIYGGDVAATYFEPAQYSELEINHIYKMVNGQEIDISDIFTDEEREKIDVILQAYLDEGE